MSLMTVLSPHQTRVLIADDHDVYRAGIAQVLLTHLKVKEVAEASTFDDALEQLAQRPFDLAIFDLDMPGMQGPTTLHEVTEVYVKTKVIIVSAITDAAVIERAKACGIRVYITKSTSVSHMVETIRATMLETVDLCNASSDLSSRVDFARRNKLTPRQADVLRCVMRGLSNKEIAQHLGIAPGTVKIHMAALFAYYSARNRTELVAKCSGVDG